MVTLGISSVHLFNKVSGSAQMKEVFQAKIDYKIDCSIGMMRPFCGFSMTDCYQNHGLLSSTHVLLIQSHSCIYSVGRFPIVVNG